MRDRGEGNIQALPFLGTGILYIIGGLFVKIETILGTALVLLGIANIIILGYVYYDE